MAAKIGLISHGKERAHPQPWKPPNRAIKYWRMLGKLMSHYALKDQRFPTGSLIR